MLCGDTILANSMIRLSVLVNLQYVRCERGGSQLEEHEGSI